MSRPGVATLRAPTALALLIASVAGCDDGTGPGGDDEDIDVVASVDAVIDVDADRAAISPSIYGSNQDHPGNVWTVRRWGGNRTTGYNWETNASNAGLDYNHNSDLFAVTSAGLPSSDADIPGVAVRHFHRQSVNMGAASILTLQMAGYVAADVDGPVTAAETAPSDRWVPVAFRKNAPLSADPALDDGVVYMDELVHYLVQEFGDAGSTDGARWYSLDNEPALWSHTHPRIHPDPVGVEALADRTIALASAVKDVDPAAEVIGPALYGMAAYLTLQDAPDWPRLGAGYDWFIDYYLDRMRAAELDGGRRLVDVLDVHWYPEARGDHRITDADATTAADVEARLQAPRTLWDPTYTEDSWIAEFLSDYLPILPRLNRAIAEHYPGTGLAITEYDYGGGGTVSGGLAQVDVLGAFGRYGVDIATLWGIDPGDTYQSTAFRLYRNYDGAGGEFGSTSVEASAGDHDQLSIWAAIEGSDAATLHVILVNKNTAGGLEVNLRIHGATSYTGGRVWGFGDGSPGITARRSIDGIAGNAFAYRIPALTAVHLVLE